MLSGSFLVDDLATELLESPAGQEALRGPAFRSFGGGHVEWLVPPCRDWKSTYSAQKVAEAKPLCHHLPLSSPCPCHLSMQTGSTTCPLPCSASHRVGDSFKMSCLLSVAYPSTATHLETNPLPTTSELSNIFSPGTHWYNPKLRANFYPEPQKCPFLLPQELRSCWNCTSILQHLAYSLEPGAKHAMACASKRRGGGENGRQLPNIPLSFLEAFLKTLHPKHFMEMNSGTMQHAVGHQICFSVDIGNSSSDLPHPQLLQSISLRHQGVCLQV